MTSFYQGGNHTMKVRKLAGIFEIGIMMIGIHSGDEKQRRYRNKEGNCRNR